MVIGGRDVTGIPPQKRGIGFVFQHYAAFKHMTVRDNVAFGLSIRKRPKNEIRDRVDELLDVAAELGLAVSTVCAVLQRLRLNRLSKLEPPEPPNRYCRRHPGELDPEQQGRTLGDDREVLQGLDGGDSVVLDPPEKLADGARVRIAGDETSADANNE